MKRILFFLLFFFFSPTTLFAAENWVINSFQSDIALKSDGTVQITEQLFVDFANEEKHGIFRDIPYIYTSENGEKTYTAIDVLSVLQNNEKAKFQESRENGYLQIKIGDPDKTISGKLRYTISYVARGVLRSFDTYDELYWNVTGNYWSVPIENTTTTLSLPNGSIERIICFQGYEGSNEECVAEQQSEKSASFRTTRQLTSNEGLTIAVGYTKGAVPILTVTPPPTLLDVATTKTSILVFISFLSLGIFSLVALWLQKGRDFWYPTRSLLGGGTKHTVKPLGAHESLVVEFLPPDKLHPAELGVLMDERADTLDITATIIDLATRGYLSITEIPKKWLFGTVDYTMTRVKYPDTALRPYEKILMERLFQSGTSVQLSSLKTTFYDDLALVKKQLYKDIESKDFFVGNPESVRTRYLLLSIGILVLGGVLLFGGANLVNGPLFTGGSALIIIGALSTVLSFFMPRRSAKGRELYQRAKGYYHFINTSEKYRQQFNENKNLFHEILPYAIVFGLTEKFAKAMNDLGITPTQPTWYSGSRPFQANLFASDINGFSKSMSSAIASTPSKSGGFSGGGSSGGGFGGGGGGSW